MHIVFGWHLDGGGCPEQVNDQPACIGQAVVGPLGLLTLLEMQIGLGGPEVSSAVRIGQYLARLRAVRDDDCFFAESLATDGWATARELLGWRDALVTGGWSGVPIAGGGLRLDKLQIVETLDLPLERGIADRLAALMGAFEADGVPLDLDRIDLVDYPAEALQHPWPCILHHLARLGVDVRAPQPIAPHGVGGDLLSAQRTLSGQAGPAYTGDGSLILLTAEDEFLASDAAAAWLAADTVDNEHLAFIRCAGSPLLDDACARLGLPRPGGERRSPWRGVLQVLPLAFETAWSPLDPARLLELLIIPDSPVPKAVGRVFARALSSEPGVGGPAWQAALQEAVDVRRASLEASGLDGAELTRKLDRDRDSWVAWLQQTPLDPADGIPKVEADRICRRMQRWAMKRSAGGSHPLFLAAASAAGSLADAIAASGMPRISRPQLGRMLDTVLADGMASPSNGADAAPWTVVDEPGQIRAPVSSVLWWNFTSKPTVPSRNPWSEAERRAIAAARIVLSDPDDSAALQAAALRRAILLARERVVLVQPRSIAGAQAPLHPVWQDIVRGHPEKLARVTIDAVDLLRSERTLLAGRQVQRARVPRRGLPQARRDWRIAPNIISPRDEESASGLAALLGCRLAWTLRYAAKIRAGDLVAIPDDDALVGILAHAIVADLLDQPVESPELARGKAEGRFDQILRAVAAPLELPGRALSRMRARAGIGRAVEALVRVMQQAGLQVQGSEVARERPYDSGKMTGRVDLLLADAENRPVIIDLKWSRSDRYRRAEIAEGRAVQLAAYAWLVGEQAAKPPVAGYFMLKQARLLAAGGAPFPASAHIGGSDLTQVWAKAHLSYTRHLRDLAAGTVTADGETLPGDDARDHELTLKAPCGLCDYARLCGATLQP